MHKQIRQESNKIGDDDNSVVIVIENTGIKFTNRGQWLRDKWSVIKKGYLKIHVAVNIKAQTNSCFGSYRREKN